MSALDRLRRPEHTGPNRCWPCTVVNLGLLGVGVTVLAVRSVDAAAVLGVVGTGAVWLRGYLVPFTPQFAPRLVDALPIQFPKASPEGRPGSIDHEDEGDGERLIETLIGAGVLLADGGRLSIDREFEGAWAQEQEALRKSSTTDLASAIDDASGTEGTRPVGDDGEWFDLGDGTWLSRPVAIAEVAAVRSLETNADLDPRVRRNAASALRGFLGRCPACETELVETSPENCCGGGDPRDLPEAVLACPDCDRQLFAFEE